MNELLVPRWLVLVVYLACLASAIRSTRRLLASLNETARWLRDWREEDRR